MLSLTTSVAKISPNPHPYYCILGSIKRQSLPEKTLTRRNSKEINKWEEFLSAAE